MIKDLGPDDPESVGPYRLLGRLGAGGTGQVYLGKSPGGWLVAVKLIRAELAEEPGFRARFASQVNAARNVSGLYTAPVVDADPEAPLPWMATGYVAGPSLATAVDDSGPLPVASVVALAGGLAEALAAIHRAGLVHGDLKPSAVLLGADGPRVMDIGICPPAECSAPAATGLALGSPGFMSPEQLREPGQAGAPADVFSLGAVLAYASTGCHPFGAGPAAEIRHRVLDEAPDLGAVPARLRRLVEQCLQQNPADRPTPPQLLARLGDDAGVLSGQWLPPSVTSTMPRYTIPGPAALAPTLVSGAALVSGPGLDPAECPPVTATTAGYRLSPETAAVLGPGGPGGSSGAGWPGWPPQPGRRSPSARIWLLPGAVAAAAVSAVAVLLVTHAHGSSPNVNSPLAGVATTAPATHGASAAKPSRTPRPTNTSAGALTTLPPPAGAEVSPSRAAATPASASSGQSSTSRATPTPEPGTSSPAPASATATPAESGTPGQPTATPDQGATATPTDPAPTASGGSSPAPSPTRTRFR